MGWFSKKEKPHSQSQAPAASLNESDFAPIFNTGTVRKLIRGEVLFREGDSDASIFYVINGALKVVADRGDQAGVPDEFREGDWTGASETKY